jgi:Cys-rich protein (TIGR01571 family)
MQSTEADYVVPRVLHGLGADFLTISIMLSLGVLYAFCYYKVVTQSVVASMGTLEDKMRTGLDSGEADFSAGICGCYNDVFGCILGLCCPMVRFAHTAHVSGVCDFWHTLWCYCCCSWMSFDCGPRLLLVFWRLRLKNIMRIEENMPIDFCFTLICPQISICQMGSSVDDAMGYKLTGIMEYTPWSYGGPMDKMNP